MASIAALVGGSALPVSAVSSLVLGWGVAADLHLVVGSPLGLPSAEEVTDWIADLNVAVEASPGTPPGLGEKLTGHDAVGRKIELSVYGTRRLRCPGAGETMAILLLPGFGA